METKKIEQGRFYKIQHKNGKHEIIEVKPTLKLECGKLYNIGIKGVVKVISEIKFKYTFEDIDNIRVLMENYDEGTIQDNLRKRMEKAFKQPTPAVRFSFGEREILSYIYHESQMLSKSEQITLEKVLNIK